jgi:protein TonB
METKALVYQHWDDLVFENRNKSYGAYLLRKSYNNKLLLGLGFSVALMTVLLALPAAVSHYFPAAKSHLRHFPDGTIEFTPAPNFQKPKQTKPKGLPVTSIRKNTTPLVVQTPVDDTKPEEPISTPSSNTEPSDTDPGATDIGTTDGIGDVPVLPPVNKKEVFLIVEQMPYYEGGNQSMVKFLQRKLRYPSSARKLGIEGTVYVSFVVNGDGSVSDVSVVRGIHPDCDHEAQRVIAMLPNWIGGKQRGVPVNVRMVLPIGFHLN